MVWEVLTMAPTYVGQVEAYTSYVRSRSSRFLLEGCVKTRILPAHSFQRRWRQSLQSLIVAVAQVTRGEVG